MRGESLGPAVAAFAFTYPFVFAGVTAALSFLLGLRLEVARLRYELPFYFGGIVTRGAFFTRLVGFVEAPQSREELASAARQLTKPALVNVFEGGKTPPLPARELEAMGYRIGIYPSQTHRAAIAAAKRVLAVLKRDGDTAAIEPELATFNDREVAVNSQRWRELETKYLKDV